MTTLTETARDAAMPRDDLFRAAFPGLELRDSGDGGMPAMVGHFAVFNQWTEINSRFEGRFLERFAPGAFAKTVQENRGKMRPLFQHGRDPQVGDKPLGPIRELREDDTGVYYEVPLLDTSYNRDLLPALREGLYGASFRFRVVKEDVVKRPTRSAYNPEGLPERTVTEAAVLEFGPVTFPAYDGATAGVRSLTDTFRGDVDPAIRDARDEHRERLYERSRMFVGSRVWMVTLEMLAIIRSVLAERAAGVKLTDEEIRERIGLRDTSDQPAAPGIAVIPISGPIVPHAGMIDRTSSELTSIENLQSQFRQALADPSIDAIVFNIDSPGGSADLVPEFATEIRNARGAKPIVAVANTDAASAAYFIASQADELVVTPSGYVGSIGVYTAHQDISAALEQEGVKMTLIHAGEFKVDGNPFEPLSDTAAAEMQSQVDAIYQVFLENVAAGRGVDVETVADKFGQGRMLMAAEAVKRGMADRVATIDQTLSRLQKQLAKNESAALASDGAGNGHSADASREPDNALATDGAGNSHSAQTSREPVPGTLRKPSAPSYNLNRKEKPSWQL